MVDIFAPNKEEEDDSKFLNELFPGASVSVPGAEDEDFANEIFSPTRQPSPDNDRPLGPISSIINAFGEGFNVGYGPEELGLSKETEKSLKDIGLFSKEDDYVKGIKLLNEAMIRPAAYALEATMRFGNGLLFGTANTVATQLPEVTGGISIPFTDIGIIPSPENSGDIKRFRRDILGLLEIGSLVWGGARIGEFKKLTRGGLEEGIRQNEEAIGINRFDEASFQRSQIKAVEDSLIDQVPVPPLAKEIVPGSTFDPVTGKIALDLISHNPDRVTDFVRQLAVDMETAGWVSKQGEVDFKAKVLDKKTKKPIERTIRSHEEAEKHASSLNMTIDDFNKRVGSVYSDIELFALRETRVQALRDAKEAALEISLRKNDSSAAIVDSLQKNVMVEHIKRNIVDKNASETGRALRAVRATKSTGDDTLDLIEELILAHGGRDSIKQLSSMLGSLDDLEEVARFLDKANNASTLDMIVEAWMMSILSGPWTHVTNMLSNTAVAITSPLETLGGAMVSTLRGTNDVDRIRFREVEGEILGLLHSMKDGLIYATRAYRTEIPRGGLDKLELEHRKSIPSFELKNPLTGGKLEFGGKQARIPGRLLQAEDSFFYTMGHRQELFKLAYRAAAREKLKGREFYRRVGELVKNPTTKMLDRARERGEAQTFTKPLGPTGQQVQQFMANHKALRFIVPFIRTPTNLLKFAAERSVLPLTGLSPKMKSILKGEKGEEAKNIAIARITIGSVLSATAIEMAAEGLITGAGPTDPKERALWLLQGNRPFSMKIGGEWFQYGRIEPISTLFGIAATSYELGNRIKNKEIENLGEAMALALSENLLSKTWLSGPVDAIKAITDPQRYGETYTQRFASSFLPNAVAQYSRSVDPIWRETYSILDAIQARVPSTLDDTFGIDLPTSQDLEPTIDILGEPLSSQGPYSLLKMKNDPLVNEMYSVGFFPSRMEKSIQGVELTPEQVTEYRIRGGKMFEQMARPLISTPNWNTLPAFVRKDTLHKMMKRSREFATKYMVMTHWQTLGREIYRSKLSEIGIDPETIQ